MIEAGKRYEVTREDKVSARRFLAVVTTVEDRGEFWYVGYTPDDFRICRWGYCKVKKEGSFKAINYRFKEVGA